MIYGLDKAAANALSDKINTAETNVAKKVVAHLACFQTTESTEPRVPNRKL
jgi:hypothetical protein